MGGGTDESEQALSYLKRFGSVTVLNVTDVSDRHGHVAAVACSQAVAGNNCSA